MHGLLHSPLGVEVTLHQATNRGVEDRPGGSCREKGASRGGEQRATVRDHDVEPRSADRLTDVEHLDDERVEPCVDQNGVARPWSTDHDGRKRRAFVGNGNALDSLVRVGISKLENRRGCETRTAERPA